MMFESIIRFIRTAFQTEDDYIPLHAPYFGGNEKKYVADAIDSTFVSSVGEYVATFEEMMKNITGSSYAIATVNGTTALHLALLVAGVKPGDEVITQPLTFVATSNAIAHAGAYPVFVDVDRATLGMSTEALHHFLQKNAVVDAGGECINKLSRRRIAACMPMHTFGFPLDSLAVKEICEKYHIVMVEDAAESLGSYYQGRHTGTFGQLGVFSFNGNKTVTAGGGGAIVTNDPQLGKIAKHLSTTAKKPHAWEFDHDMTGYNYRMPNLNAALACAQLEQLDKFLQNKRDLSKSYAAFFADTPICFYSERPGTTANYWLNTIIMSGEEEKSAFLRYANDHKVMCRPAWKLMNKLPMYKDAICGDLSEARWLEERIVNLPSSYRPGK